MSGEKDILAGFDNWEEAAKYYAEQCDEYRKDIEMYVKTKVHWKTKYEEELKESVTFQARKDTLEEWLTEFRDELKKTNVYHKNQGLINEINELLNWPL